jgi:ketosteroid isomerase-like protein
MDERRGDGGLPEDVAAERRATFLASLRQGDAKAASAVYAETARLLPPSAEPMRGREAIQAFWQAGLEAGLSDVELEPLELECQDGLAYEIGRYRLRLEPPGGGPVVDRGTYLLIHGRQVDGSWLRAVEMFNPDRPPAAIEPRAESGRVR